MSYKFFKNIEGEVALVKRLSDNVFIPFDTENVDAHQAVSYSHILTNRVKSLSEHSQPAEVVNAAGPLQTVQRLMTKDGKLKQFDGKAPELPVKEREPQLTDGEDKNE